MIDLQLTSGLPLKFDEIAERFQYGENLVYDSLNRVPLKALLPGLLNKSLRYPEVVYMEHSNIHTAEHAEIFSEKSLKYDLLMIPAGLMGVEFIRTHIFYSAPSLERNGVAGGLAEIIEVYSGRLTILLQRNAPKGEFDFDTKVSEGLVVKMRAGEKFMLPRGYFYTFINTRTKPTVFSRFYSTQCSCDYSQIKKEQGLAYFAIRKNARQEIVLNPRYRDIPEIRQMRCESLAANDFSESMEYSSALEERPMYAQIVDNYTKLRQIFN